MSKLPRRKVPDSTLRKLRLFYEGRPVSRLTCVITQDDIQVELHHLDENPANSDEEYNLVPLRADLNRSIEQRPVRALHESLSFKALDNHAQFLFARGKYAPAYGCAAVGISLALNIPWNSRNKAGDHYIDADIAAGFCASALVNLRPLNRLDYAVYVMQHYIDPLVARLGRSIENPTLSRVALEIGSYFRDSARYVDAQRFTELARRFLHGQVKSVRVRTALARSWLHDAISKIGQEDLEGAKHCLEEMSKEATHDYSTSDATRHLYEASIEMRTTVPDFDRIAALIEKFPEDSDPLVLSRWTNRELRMAEAEAYFRRQGPLNRREAFDRLKVVLDDLSQDRIVPVRATFATSLKAFANKYPDHAAQVRMLLRRLPAEFSSVAAATEKRLRTLAG